MLVLLYTFIFMLSTLPNTLLRLEVLLPGLVLTVRMCKASLVPRRSGMGTRPVQAQNTFFPTEAHVEVLPR